LRLGLVFIGPELQQHRFKPPEHFLLACNPLPKTVILSIDGVAVIRITDETDGEEGEARSLKNARSRRNVPPHPALVAEGFMAYVNDHPPRSSR
jgi:hypothetical protein